MIVATHGPGRSGTCRVVVSRGDGFERKLLVKKPSLGLKCPVGKTTIYQSVNHGSNIQPAAHRVWYTLISLGFAAVSQRLSLCSSSEVCHDNASSLAKVGRNDKGRNLEQRKEEHAEGLWPWNGARCGNFPEPSDLVWRSLRTVDNHGEPVSNWLLKR